MTAFDTIVMVDWSGAGRRSARGAANSIWYAVSRREDERARATQCRTRAEAERDLQGLLRADLEAGRRVLAGFDFAFAFPAGTAAALTGRADPFAVWDWLAERIEDGHDNRNNRFAIADAFNAALPGIGPFWNVPDWETAPLPHIPRRKAERDARLPDHRAVERAASGRPQSVWNLSGAGVVGGQTLVGLPLLARLRRCFGGALGIWPFQTDAAETAPIVLAEIYPSLLSQHVKNVLDRERADAPAGDARPVKDAAQVRLMADALHEMQRRGALGRAFAAPDRSMPAEEGWILGVGVEGPLREAAAQAGAVRRPLGEARVGAADATLRNDCFALPPGVNWTPVDLALDHLRASLAPVVGTERRALDAAAGRVLAEDVPARRANPPGANAAVDGYGFAAATLGPPPHTLALLDGRAAAGAPYRGSVPAGTALHVLTGALLPEGVDTLVLDEEARVADGNVAFPGPVKPGANTRVAGEDVVAGAPALAIGRVLRPPDLALLAATGTPAVAVRTPLRIGVLSTGDEIAEPDPTAPPEATFDANRPMLLALAAGWGCRAVDLGRVGDDRAALADRLDQAAGATDMVLTSGGASASDADHVSALLQDTGTLATWRVALKPGRPLALGLWRGVPVFGLPGNPVAALVCALVFARPAASVLAGAGWVAPQGFAVPAAFTKAKKAGRREFLRARLDGAGRAEVFPSEGSGRISGLAWAEGLVELADGARHIRPGDPVRYLPYSSFGL